MGDYLVQVRRLICGMLCTAICLCLFVPENKVKAETTGNFYGYYVVQEVVDDVEMVDQTVPTSGTTSYLYRYYSHYEYTIITNDPACAGAVNLTHVGSVSYGGTYTHGSSGSNTGTFYDYPNSASISNSNISLYRASGPINSTTSVTQITQLDATQLSNLITALSNVSIDTTDIEGYLSAIESLINDIDIYISNMNQSIGMSLGDDMSDAATNTLNISNAMTVLQSYLENYIYHELYDQSLLLDTLITRCNTIVSRLETINSTIASGFSHLEQNIDDIIDTISWQSLDASWQLSNDGINWYDSGYISITSERPYGYLRLTNRYLSTQAIYKMYLNVGTALSGLQNDLILDEGFVSNGVFTATNNSQFIYYSSLVNRYTPKLNLYLANVYDRNASTQRYTLRVSFNGTNLRLYIPDSFSVLYQDDIEYWQLLDSITLQQWFSLYKKDQTTTSQNIVNATQQLTQQNNQLVAFEDQFTNNMNQSLNDINLNLDLEGGLSDFNSTLSYFTTVNDTVMQIPYIKYSILLILVFALIGLIL